MRWLGSLSKVAVEHMFSSDPNRFPICPWRHFLDRRLIIDMEKTLLKWPILPLLTMKCLDLTAYIYITQTKVFMISSIIIKPSPPGPFAPLHIPGLFIWILLKLLKLLKHTFALLIMIMIRSSLLCLWVLIRPNFLYLPSQASVLPWPLLSPTRPPPPPTRQRTTALPPAPQMVACPTGRHTMTRLTRAPGRFLTTNS